MFDDCVTKKAEQLGLQPYGVFVRAKRAYGLDRANVDEDYKRWQEHGVRPEYVNQFIGRT